MFCGPRGNFRALAEAVADCALVVGTTSRGPRALEHPLRRLEQGGQADRQEAGVGAGGAAVRLGEIWPVQRRSEPLPLAAAHSHARGAWLDELGQAVAVCLYEIIRQTPGKAPGKASQTLAQPPAKPPAGAEDLERVTLLLEEVLAASGYVHAGTGGSTRLKLRRLVRRMALDQHDAVVWLGMLRQIGVEAPQGLGLIPRSRATVT